MPVNLFPIYAVIAILWVATIFVLTKWSRNAALVFSFISILTLITSFQYTGIEKEVAEDMPYQITRIGAARFVEFTSVRGERFSLTDPKISAHLEEKNEKKARIILTATYDFGRLRAYDLQSVDGEKTR